MRCIVLAMLLTACVSYEPPGGPESGPDAGPGAGSGSGSGPGDAGSAAARVAFDNEVAPIFAATCAGCHSVLQEPVFVDLVDPTGSYDLVMTYPQILGDFQDSAPIATHHAGSSIPWYSSLELGSVKNWLAIERRGR